MYIIVVFLSFFLISCTSGTLRDRRINENFNKYSKLSSVDRNLVSQGKIRLGMSPDSVYLSWGKPDRIQSGEKLFNGKKSHLRETWYYYGNHFRPSFHFGIGHHDYLNLYRDRRHDRYKTSGSYGSGINVDLYIKKYVEFINNRVTSWREEINSD